MNNVLGYVAQMDEPLPRTDLEWKNFFRAQFDLPGTNLNGVVRDLSREFQNADPRERDRLSGIFGGFVRRQRSAARIDLTHGILDELDITATQHVASVVMKRLFGASASTATLDRYFAQPGRDASEKFVAAAIRTLDNASDTSAKYAELYLWYCDELSRRVSEIRASPND